jgi:hypothetical protein
MASLKVLRKGVSTLADLADGLAFFGLYGGGRAWRVNSRGSGDYSTIQAAVDAASEGDVILIDGQAEYDENVTIAKSKLTFVGVGAPRSVRVTSVGTNSTCFTINGGADIALYNLNISGRGTGSALELTGQIRRFTASDCRFGGPSSGNGVEIASSAGGQVVDVIFERCRFEGADGVEFSVGEGGDPASQVYFKNCDFQYCAVLAINHPTNGYSTGLFVQNCMFLPEEDGTVPSTGWIKADNAAQTGAIIGCFFADATHDDGRIALDAGVLYVGNYAEEGNNGAYSAAIGTSGRPD